MSLLGEMVTALLFEQRVHRDAVTIASVESNASTDGYRPIRDYAILGDGHTAALVASNGSIDWCCWPRFDSPAVFCRLLDCHKGGWFQVRPAGGYRSSRNYEPNTNVLQTTFDSDGSRFRLTDFMPVEPRLARGRGKDPAGSSRILRCAEGLSGENEIEVGVRPTFDFARQPAILTVHEGGVVARCGDQTLALVCPGCFSIGTDGAARATLRLAAGERMWMALVYGADLESALDAAAHAECELGSTREFWERWSERCTYHGPRAELVRRSALALKLLIYSPTGALVAAPTTSLPESIGSDKNWDYRYAWLRDSTLTIDALATVGYCDEARGFFEWLERLDLHRRAGDPQIMYTISGDSELPERSLDHLEGYRGSRPVRVGNAASNHIQLDMYGEVLGAAYSHFDRTRARLDADTWKLLSHLAGEVATRWREDDRSIWETRGRPKPFLYSKLRCWVAVDRAIRMANDLNLPADLAAWSSARAEIASAILNQGFDSDVGAFTQAFGSQELDASALTISHVGFLPAADPRMRATTQKICEVLTDHGLVRRYLPDEGAGVEGAFTLCSFWLADNLAMQGQPDAAQRLFEDVTRRANDVGLLSEEIDPASGDLLGNFPQGLAHLGLIRTAALLGGEAAGDLRRSASARPAGSISPLHDRREILESRVQRRSPKGALAPLRPPAFCD